MNGSKPTDKVVILDRDGTVIVDRHYLSDPAGLELLPGAAEGLRRLHERGYRLVIITNQSGVGRGLLSVARLHEIHDRFREMVNTAGARLEAIYYCPHVPDDGCDCRKPRLGLFKRAAADLGFLPRDAIVVGDKESDVEFGRRAGAKTILLAREVSVYEGETADFIATDLVGAANAIERLLL
jgi:D-glycero-D-manno-heptose 1,7-bisphosphate phosphatase